MNTEESIKRTIRLQRRGNNPVESIDINELVIKGTINLVFLK